MLTTSPFLPKLQDLLCHVPLIYIYIYKHHKKTGEIETHHFQDPLK